MGMSMWRSSYSECSRGVVGVHTVCILEDGNVETD